MQEALYRLGLGELVRGLREGAVTSEAYVRSCLARTRALEPHIHASAWFDADAALERARQADRTRDRHGGHLHGVPFAVKDIIDTAGIPTEHGSAVFRGRVPDRSAAVVQRLEAAGGFVFGKTVTAELAYLTPGATANPWNPAHTPGGSSSGSAAAVAAGFVPLALGTQTNGSVIRPAAFCGVVGFKPSAGLIQRKGILPFSTALDHVGIFARSVQDVAMAAHCLAGSDADDTAFAVAALVRCNPDQPLSPLHSPPRLAVVRSPVWERAEPGQRDNLEQVALRLAQAGARVETLELPPDFAEAHALHRTIMFGEGARHLRSLQAVHRERLSQPLNALIDEGSAISQAALDHAYARRLQLSQRLLEVFSRVDALLTPPATGEAPATLTQTGDPAFCTLWTLIGVPAITIPSGFGPHGLPLGVQIVGPFLHDNALLEVAHWSEAQLGLAPLIAPPGADYT